MTEIDKTGSPFGFKGQSYVALAPLVRSRGGNVQWDNQSKIAHIDLNGSVITVRMADDAIEVNGERVPISSPPLVVDDTLIVPEEVLQTILV